MWYHVAEANSYLAITGAGIKTVEIKKKAFVYPLQRVSKFSITPFDFSMSLHAMTVEKLKFSLPAVFTIGPSDDYDALVKYATLLTGGDNGAGAPRATSGAVAVGEGRRHVQDIVKGVIEGETRSIVSNMTMEELFSERKVFRDNVIKNVQSELDQFGLRIYNANVKELQDTPGSEYFAYLSRKAHEGASNQAKVDVADARMRGEVGEAERLGKTKQEIAKIDAATAVLETERKGEKAVADAALADKKINIDKELNISRISAQRAAEAHDAELQKTVELRRAEMELEKQRADTVTKAVIKRESDQEKAKADLFTQETKAAGTKAAQLAEADAQYYKITKEAEAAKLAKELAADAHFYAQKQEAQGLVEMAHAYGALANVMGGPQGLMQYMMLQNNTYEALANANAKAIHGMQPKISIWNTGAASGQGEGGASLDATAPIRNLFQNLPPLLSTINDQTGIKPPSWLVNMPEDRDTYHHHHQHHQQLMGGKDGVQQRQNLPASHGSPETLSVSS